MKPKAIRYIAVLFENLITNKIPLIKYINLTLTIPLNIYNKQIAPPKSNAAMVSKHPRFLVGSLSSYPQPRT